MTVLSRPDRDICGLHTSLMWPPVVWYTFVNDWKESAASMLRVEPDYTASHSRRQVFVAISAIARSVTNVRQSGSVWYSRSYLSLAAVVSESFSY